MHLLRSLHFFLAAYQIGLTSEHIKSSQNSLADAMSRNSHHIFLSEFPSAEQVPTGVHSLSKWLLVDHQVDWILQAWRDLLSNTLIRD